MPGEHSKSAQAYCIATLITMSNLIPTPIVDKNGVITTRHKKQGSAKTLKKGTIPRVAAKGSSTVSSTTVDGEELLGLLYPDMTSELSDREHVLASLKLIQQHSSDELDLGLELIRTGSPTASALVRKEIDFNVMSVNILRGREDRFNYEENVRVSAKLDPITLHQAWNCGNVMEESGFTEDTGIPGRMKNIARQELKRELPKLNLETTDDSLWRGVAAFTIVDQYDDSKESMTPKQKSAVKIVFYREAKKFIDYAGKHKDIGLVIRTAKKHGTIVVNDLKDILARGDVAPAMRDGVL